MGFVPEKDALRRAATRQKILEAGFRLFAERTIDNANLTDVAKAAGVGMGTVYRYFNSKQELVTAINSWAWGRYVQGYIARTERKGKTAREELEVYLEAYIDLYRHHRDLLRFNSYFNAYVGRGSLTDDMLTAFSAMIGRMKARFHGTYAKGEADGTLRTDVSEAEMFSATLHLMLAAVTRYAVGLVYDSGIDPERELILLKDMLLHYYSHCDR